MDVGFCYGIVCEGWFMGFYLEVAGRWSVVCRGLWWNVYFHQI